MNENNITSLTNEKIKEIKKLYDKKYRIQNKQYIIEGIKIIQEAFLQKQSFVTIVICEEIYRNVNIDKSVVSKVLNENEEKILYVDNKVFNSVCDTKTPQGIIAVLEMKTNNLLCVTNSNNENVLFLDNIQDAGNMGTILRSARAFGFDTVILNKGCIDIYNPKVIRATMGNIFMLHILQLQDEGKEMLLNLKKNGYTVYATTLENSIDIYDVIVYNNKKVLVVGNEANGIQQEILKLSDVNISIPMLNNTESLNVGVATSIVMSEIQRRNIYNLE